MSDKLIRSGLATKVCEHGTVRDDIGQVEWVRLLRAKLLEEAGELALARHYGDIVSEMADVLDVIEGMQVALGVGEETLNERRAAKRQERGDFTLPLVWDPEGKR